MHARVPRRITTLREAVVLLGFREVRSTALAGCLLAAGPLPPFMDYTRFWLNSVVIGQLAEMLAESSGRHREDAFTAGIIHNVGRLALAQHRPDQLGGAVRTALEEGRTIHDVQRDRFGFTDADLGAALAEAWEFPPPFCEAVRFHASSERSLREPDALAALVLKARRFARASGTTDGLDEESQITPDIEWASPATASAFQRRGGMDGIRERAEAFLGEMGQSSRTSD